MSFRIETVRKKAGVFFPDGSRIGGNFFVLPVSPIHGGAEMLSELLADERNFIPFEVEDGKIALLRKENIRMICVEEKEGDNNHLNTRQIDVRLCFVSGETMQGTIHYELPESHSRLSDFLNGCDEFFHFESGDKSYLVNTRFIKTVCPDSL